MAKALQTNATQTICHLICNAIYAMAAKELDRALAGNSSLRTLDSERNQIESERTKCWATALNANATLTTL